MTRVSEFLWCSSPVCSSMWARLPSSVPPPPLPETTTTTTREVNAQISAGQTCTDISNLCCDLDLEPGYPIFAQGTRLMMLYYQTMFGCKQTSSLEDRVENVIFWLFKPSLWPWHWRQRTNFSAWHSGSWLCITISNFVWKWSAVPKR